MSAQFIHLETYARVSPLKATQRQWTIREILDEVARTPGRCPHVSKPRTPAVLYGAPLNTVAAILDARTDGATDAKGRKLRRDAKILLAGVTSYPVTCDALRAAARPAVEEYLAWREASCRWLQKRFGDALVSIAEHGGDEAHPHLHFLAIPHFRLGQRMEDFHPGVQARNRTAGGKGEKDAAYKAAMSTLQSEFWNDVSAAFEHTTKSRAPRKRWKYRQWKEIKTHVAGLESQVIRLHSAHARLMEWTGQDKPTSDTPDRLEGFGERGERDR